MAGAKKCTEEQEKRRIGGMPVHSRASIAAATVKKIAMQRASLFSRHRGKYINGITALFACCGTDLHTPQAPHSCGHVHWQAVGVCRRLRQAADPQYAHKTHACTCGEQNIKNMHRGGRIENCMVQTLKYKKSVMLATVGALKHCCTWNLVQGDLTHKYTSCAPPEVNCAYLGRIVTWAAHENLVCLKGYEHHQISWTGALKVYGIQIPKIELTAQFLQSYLTE